MDCICRCSGHARYVSTCQARRHDHNTISKDKLPTTRGRSTLLHRREKQHSSVLPLVSSVRRYAKINSDSQLQALSAPL